MILFLSDSYCIAHEPYLCRVQKNLLLRRIPGTLVVLLPVILARLPLIPLGFCIRGVPFHDPNSISLSLAPNDDLPARERGVAALPMLLMFRGEALRGFARREKNPVRADGPVIRSIGGLLERLWKNGMVMTILEHWVQQAELYMIVGRHCLEVDDQYYHPWCEPDKSWIRVS